MKHKITSSAFVLATAMLVLFGSFASAGETLYRWKDERGNPVNSDRPPPIGVEYEVISTSSSMVRKVEADEGAVALKVKPTPGNEFEQTSSDVPVVEKNPEFCERAKDNLAQIDSNARIRMRNDQGEVRYLSEEEKAAEREKALTSIEAYCE